MPSKKKETKKEERVLLLDIETRPLLAYCWKIWDENIGLNQIEEDICVISWAAKWLDDDKVMYADQRNAKDIEDDKKMIEGIFKLIDKADVIITQNGKRFDAKHLNTRFLIDGLGEPSSYQHIDTLKLAKKHFYFTSYSLEYMAKKLNLPHQKSKHAKFPGIELWKQCLRGNKEAWNEMEEYNKFDVLVLEDLYKVLRPWEHSFNPNLFTDDIENVCTCGSKETIKKGFAYTSNGKYQRYKCLDCNRETRSKTNLLEPEKRKALTK